MEPADRLRALIAFWHGGLETIERRVVKGYGWLSEFLGLHACIEDAQRQLRDLGEL
jgi:hypothetical protein